MYTVMRRQSIAQKLTLTPDHVSSSLQLTDGSNVAIVGGGPAGSYFAYFLLSMADMIDLDLQVDVGESGSLSDDLSGCDSGDLVRKGQSAL